MDENSNDNSISKRQHFSQVTVLLTVSPGQIQKLYNTV